MLAGTFNFGSLGDVDVVLVHDKDLYIRAIDEGNNRAVVELSQFIDVKSNTRCQFLNYKYNTGERSIVYLDRYLLETRDAFNSIFDNGEEFGFKEVSRGDFLVMSYVVDDTVKIYFDDLLDFSFGFDTSDDLLYDYFELTRGKAEEVGGDGEKIPF